jgi:hypothetical protein
MVAEFTNLSEAGILLRLRRSVIAFAATLGATATLAWAEVHPAWFLALALPFFGAFQLSYQGLFKT